MSHVDLQSLDCCAVREWTADGVNAGRCWHTVKDGICPRHGDVREVQERYAKGEGMTDDYDLPRKVKVKRDR